MSDAQRPAEIAPRCPTHGIRDCSPLLNACSFFTAPRGLVDQEPHDSQEA